MTEPALTLEEERQLREASVVRINTLTVEAANVTIAKKEEPPSAEMVARVRWNAARFALAAILFYAWFRLHLETWATHTVIFGTATLWAAWQFILSVAKKDLGDAGDELRKRFLAREQTREHLIFAIGIAVILLVTTSSFYVQLDDRERQDVRIEVTKEPAKDETTTVPVMPHLELTSGTRIGGRIFVPRFRAQNLTVTVLEPAGYTFNENPVELRPWSAARFTFPDDFTKKKLHAVRVVPGITLADIEATPPPADYVLTVMVGQDRITVPDFKFRTAYLGVYDQPALAALVQRETNDAFTNELNAHLQARAIPQAEHTAYLTNWKKPPRLHPSRDFTARESVVATLSLNGTQIAASTPSSVGDGEITTLILEMP